MSGFESLYLHHADVVFKGQHTSLPSWGYGFDSRHSHSAGMRFNGSLPASQAVSMGLTPVACSTDAGLGSVRESCLIAPRSGLAMRATEPILWEVTGLQNRLCGFDSLSAL
jgi:hypothetical protein